MGLPQSGLGWIVRHGDEVESGLGGFSTCIFRSAFGVFFLSVQVGREEGCCVDIGVEVVVVVGRLGLRRSPCCLLGAVVWLSEVGSGDWWVFSPFSLFGVDWVPGLLGSASGVRWAWVVPVGAASSPVLLVGGGLTLGMVDAEEFDALYAAALEDGGEEDVREAFFERGGFITADDRRSVMAALGLKWVKTSKYRSMIVRVELGGGSATSDR
ncbi:Calmodulin-like protein 4 [Striga hermonthica]|uniref:Calmodulin-like protein 4 n=1 Tax=Striga hermonthica TaxID=68872 RepID=A0A9N7NZR9_STRHE|nr:Calmodulin-like protein 4 [Striga hermonthica]